MTVPGKNSEDRSFFSCQKLSSQDYLALVPYFVKNIYSYPFHNEIFQKKPKQGGLGEGGVEDIFFWNPSWNFSFFYYTPGNCRQKNAQTLDNPQNCVKSLGNSKAKNNDPWKFHIIFSVILGNSTSFLINPRKLQMLFLWYPSKFHILKPPVWIFPRIVQIL